MLRPLIALIVFALAPHALLASPEGLVGRDAPAFELATLDGGSASSADLSRERPVVLDFWATWCPPCIAALPALQRIDDDYDGRADVVTINLREDARVVEEFMERHGLSMPVLMDAEGTVARAYGVSAIPTTVIVGTDGRVFSAHVGFAGEEQIRTELDALLAGKTLDETARELRTDRARGMGVRALDLETVSDRGARLVTSRGADGAFAIVRSNGIVLVSPDAGSRVVKARAPRNFYGGFGVLLRAEENGPVMATSLGWGNTIELLHLGNGAAQSVTPASAVNDIAPVDLNGDGVDELVAGFNGGGGIIAYRDGEQVWRNADLGNVWSITSGDLDGDGTHEIIGTSARGDVHIINADGTTRETRSVPIYVNKVRFAHTVEGKAGVLIASSLSDRSPRIALVSAEGRPVWRSTIDVENGFGLSFVPSPAHDLVLAVVGEDVFLLDNANGSTIGVASVRGLTGAYWAEGDDGGYTPMLVDSRSTRTIAKEDMER
ncbi:MAG: redoxin domain-containing protein [Planctomycetota bacterium]